MADQNEKREGTVIPVNVNEEIGTSYLNYAMSVIVGRALPDVRDGLKPVHRRILYAMHRLKMFHGSTFKKAAIVVGEVLGKYHPHGDLAVYNALVRMAQSFSLRYPLVLGQGNFGSVDGDPPAAMRYTECKMQAVAHELLLDLEKNTVDMQLNYDDSRKEPKVLPSKIPNLLLNGSTGIAVGMATSIPSHNLSEVMDGLCAVIDNPEITLAELLQHVKGPDFPTFGMICGTKGFVEAYETGRGKVVLRGRVNIEDDVKPGYARLVICELPYQVNKADLLAKIAGLVRDKRIEGISEIRDESNRKGMRAVIELKRKVVPALVLNQLYANTQLQSTFGISMLALVGGKPKILSLKEMMRNYLEYQQDVLRRQVDFDLQKALARLHIIEALRKALLRIEDVIRWIRESKDVEEAGVILRSELGLDEIQSSAILNMRLHRLTNLEVSRLDAEYKKLKDDVAEYRSILADETKQYAILRKNFVNLKSKYGDARRTEILYGETGTTLTHEDLTENEKNTVVLTRQGFIKRLPMDLHKEQRRGGVGSMVEILRANDIVQSMFVAWTHDHLFLFSNFGRVFSVRAFALPLVDTRGVRGRSLKLFLSLLPGENIRVVRAVSWSSLHDSNLELLSVTKFALVRRLPLKTLLFTKTTGIRFMCLKEGDELVDALIVEKHCEVFLCTSYGRGLRLREDNIRMFASRLTKGVRSVNLDWGAKIAGAIALKKDGCGIFVMSRRGYGKVVDMHEFQTRSKGGKGKKVMRVCQRNRGGEMSVIPEVGEVVALAALLGGENVMVVTAFGKIIKMSSSEIPRYSRNARGLRLLNLKGNDEVVGLDVYKGLFEENTNGIGGKFGREVL